MIFFFSFGGNFDLTEQLTVGGLSSFYCCWLFMLLYLQKLWEVCHHRGAYQWQHTTNPKPCTSYPPMFCPVWPHPKANQTIRRCHPCARKSASQAALIDRMQLTLHATRLTLTALRDWCKRCLPGENPTCSVPAL